jgi:hypothetical protein
MTEVLDVVRIQLIAWRSRVLIPLGVLALVIAANMAVFVLIADAVPRDSRITGAVLAAYFTVGSGYLQALTQVFPFALGLGVTRRAFAAGMALLGVVEAAAYGLLIWLLGLVEQATGGWGMRLQFFDLGFLHQDDQLLRWLVYTVPFLPAFALFALIGVVFKRWGQNGVWALLLGSGLALGGLTVLITWRDWWPDLGAWFAGQPVLALTSGYPLVVAVVAGALGWLALRRATP